MVLCDLAFPFLSFLSFLSSCPLLLPARHSTLQTARDVVGDRDEGSRAVIITQCIRDLVMGSMSIFAQQMNTSARTLSRFPSPSPGGSSIEIPFSHPRAFSTPAVPGPHASPGNRVMPAAKAQPLRGQQSLPPTPTGRGHGSALMGFTAGGERALLRSGGARGSWGGDERRGSPAQQQQQQQQRLFEELVDMSLVQEAVSGSH